MGLWGDGDEVVAIEEAFAAIGVALPVEDAPKWIQVGDLWDSVIRVAPSVATESGSWDEFRKGLSVETCVDWTKVGSETKLLDGRGHSILRRLITSLRERVLSKHG